MGPFSVVTRYFFVANWGGSWPILRPNFHSLSDKSMSSKKVPPLEADANRTRLKTASRAVLPSPFVSPVPNTLRRGRATSDLG
jgi:hypothetical protein